MVVFAMTVVVVECLNEHIHGKRKYDVSLPPDKLE
jgi:hypothetical protein